MATSFVHSKLDYCNSLYYKLSNCQLHRLKQIQNSLARAVIKAPVFTHVTHILKSLHWLKINKRIEYKILAISLLAYKLLNTQTTTSHPYDLISLQLSPAALVPHRNDRGARFPAFPSPFPLPSCPHSFPLAFPPSARPTCPSPVTPSSPLISPHVAFPPPSLVRTPTL